MKTLLFWGLALLTMFLTSCAEDEPEWSAADVCPEAGTNRYGMPNRGTFTDERDGRVYKYTTIGDQVWMAENLKYDAPYSACPIVREDYEKKYCFGVEKSCTTQECCSQKLCEIFGRYYSIVENGKGQGIIDRNLADTICPKGWHVPIKKELEILFDNMTGNDDEWSAADRMKSSDSNMFFSPEHLPPGSNDCGFSIISSGSFEQNGTFYLTSATILTSTQVDVDREWVGFVDNRIALLRNDSKTSIRCIKD